MLVESASSDSSDYNLFAVGNADGNKFEVRGDGNVGIGMVTGGASGRLHVLGDGTHPSGLFMNGHVGIGTESPIYPFHIEKSLNNWVSYIRNTSTNNGFGLLVESASSDSSTYNLFELGNADGSKLVVKGDGKVGIGTWNPQGTLDVNGAIFQRGSELHADYVFEADYKLETIEQHAAYMWKHKHLKAIPKAKVDAEGREVLELGAHRKGIVEELEKAHVYIEELHRDLKEQQREIEALKIENVELQQTKAELKNLKLKMAKFESTLQKLEVLVTTRTNGKAE